MDGEVRMISFISEERGNSRGSTGSVIVSKFSKWEQSIPIILLIITKYPEVLFQGLICTFCLAIAFRMITGGKMELHVECFSEGTENPGDEFRSTIGGDMFWNSVF